MDRRRFLRGLMSGAAAVSASATFLERRALAQSAQAGAPQPVGASPRELRVSSRSLEVNGKGAKVFGLAAPDGTPGLTLDADSSFDVALSNAADAPTLIHWHGLTPPWVMDGVPDNPAPPIKPSEARRYTFPVGAGGTYWMHAHTLQEQNLLAAPLIVRTKADKARDEQEVVILLHDFSFTPAEELLAKLKSKGPSMDHMAMNHGGGTQGMGGMPHHGMAGMSMGAMSGSGHDMPGMKMSGMKMSGMGSVDLNDIDYDAYLANDRTLDDPQIVKVEKGGHVRLRIINGAAATGFSIDTGTIEGELIAVDGQDVVPVKGRSFPISMGQRLDIRLRLPQTAASFPILALREGARERTGIILAEPGAAIGKIPVSGEAKGPALGFELERRLRAAAPLVHRQADRSFALELTGNMADYSWAIEGGDALQVKEGERVEIAMRNMSMMAHPMHLHGHHFQVTALNGKRIAGAMRDTVLVPPMGSATIAFEADNPGHWPFHCHHLYHMESGMMAYVSYVGLG